MNDHQTFQQLMNEYMKKNFDDLMDTENDKNSLFNMMIAHLLMNWDTNLQVQVEKTEPNLDEINEYLDMVILKNKQMYENTLQLLKKDIPKD